MKALEKDFVKYLQALVPFLSIGLQNWEASTVSSPKSVCTRTFF